MRALCVAIALLALPVKPAAAAETAAAGPRIFISVDMEGIAGVVTALQRLEARRRLWTVVAP